MSEGRKGHPERYYKNVDLELTEHRLDVSASTKNKKKLPKSPKHNKAPKFDPAVEDIAFQPYNHRSLFTQYKIDDTTSKPPLRADVSRRQHGGNYSPSPNRRLPHNQQDKSHMSLVTDISYRANTGTVPNQLTPNRKSILRQHSDDLVQSQQRHGETVNCTPSSSKSSSLRSSTSSNKRVRFQDEVRRKVVPSPDLVELIRSDSESSLSSSSSGNLHSLSDHSISSGTGSLHDIKQLPGTIEEMNIEDCLPSPESELGKPLSLSKLTRQYSSNDSDYSTENDSLYGLDHINKHEGKYTSAESFHSSAYSSSSSTKLLLNNDNRFRASVSTSESSDEEIRRRVKKAYKPKDEDLDSGSSNSTLADTSSSESEIVLASGTRIKREKFTSGSDFESNAESGTDNSSENGRSSKPFWLMTVVEHRSLSPDNIRDNEKEIDFLYRAGKRKKIKCKTENEKVEEFMVEQETLPPAANPTQFVNNDQDDENINSILTSSIMSDPSLTAITPLEGSELSIQPNSTPVVEELNFEDSSTSSTSSWEGVKAPYDLVKQIVKHTQSCGTGNSLFHSSSLSASENSLFHGIHGVEHERLKPLYSMIQTEEELESTPIIVSIGTMTDINQNDRNRPIIKSTSMSELEVSFARNKNKRRLETCNRSIQVTMDANQVDTSSSGRMSTSKDLSTQFTASNITRDVKSISETAKNTSSTTSSKINSITKELSKNSSLASRNINYSKSESIKKSSLSTATIKTYSSTNQLTENGVVSSCNIDSDTTGLSKNSCITKSKSSTVGCLKENSTTSSKATSIVDRQQIYSGSNDINSGASKHSNVSDNFSTSFIQKFSSETKTSENNPSAMLCAQDNKKLTIKKFAYQKCRQDSQGEENKLSGSGKTFEESDSDSECSFEYVNEEMVIQETQLDKDKHIKVHPQFESDSDDYESATSSVSDPELSIIKNESDVNISLILDSKTQSAKKLETVSTSSYTSLSNRGDSDTIALREDCPQHIMNISTVSSSSSSTASGTVSGTTSGTKSDTPQYGTYDLVTSEVKVSSSQLEDSVKKCSVGEVSLAVTKSENMSSLSCGEVISSSSSNPELVVSTRNEASKPYRNIDQYLKYLSNQENMAEKASASPTTSSLVNKFPVEVRTETSEVVENVSDNSKSKSTFSVAPETESRTDNNGSSNITPIILSALKKNNTVEYITKEATTGTDVQTLQRKISIDEKTSSTTSNAFLMQLDRTISSTLEKIPSLTNEIFSSLEQTKPSTSASSVSSTAEQKHSVLSSNTVPRLSTFSKETDPSSLRRRRGFESTTNGTLPDKNATLYSSYGYSNVEIISDISTSDEEDASSMRKKSQSYKSSYSSKIRASQEAPRKQLVPYDDDDVTADLSTDNDVVSLRDYEVFHGKKSDLVYSLVLNSSNPDEGNDTTSDTKAAGDAYCKSSSTNSKLETDDEITEKSTSRSFASWKEDYGLLRALKWMFCPCAEA